MKANASEQFVIWNTRGNQRIRPYGYDGKSVFDSREEAIRERNEFHNRLLDFGVVMPATEIKPVSELAECDPELAAAVRGPWNNAD